jgi:hypothetical protein
LNRPLSGRQLPLVLHCAKKQVADKATLPPQQLAQNRVEAGAGGATAFGYPAGGYGSLP